MQPLKSLNGDTVPGLTPGTQDLLLGLDVGTTTARALVFDLQGHPVAEAYREVAIVHPRPGWAELDAEECWRATIEVIHSVLRQDESFARRLLAIGLTGLLHALVPVGAEGTPLSRAMLWLDHRCAPQAAWLQREHSDLIRSATGSTSVTTTFSAPKLRWLVEHEPGLVGQTSVFLPMKDYVRLRLTGKVATDPSDARGTMLLDVHTEQWCTPLLDVIGVPVAKLPPIHGSAEVIGGVTAGAAEVTGLRAGTPVVVGAGDTTTTRIGADAEGNGRACVYLGTAAWMSVPRQRPGCFAATATTGAALRWLVELLAPEQGRPPAKRYEALLAEAATASPGAGSLIFLPHLMGERGPVYNPDAKGVLFGLTLAHGKAEIARAVLEGCAFHIRSILDLLVAEPLSEIIVVGGGAKSALWRTVIAGVTGTTVLVPAVLEAGALGAAILGGVGVGAYVGVEEASREVVRIADRVTPDPDDVSFYDRLYRVYLDLEGQMTELYPRLPIEEVL